MKKFLFLVAAWFAVSAAAAQTNPQAKLPADPHTEPHSALPRGFTPGTRFSDRLWFGVVYTPKFLLSESVSTDFPMENHRKTAHNYALEAGYMLTPHLSVGLGLSYERDWLKTGGAVDLIPAYLQAHYFYGKRGGGWFNYARLGGLLSADSGIRSGFTGGAGVGYRLKLHRRFGVDLKAGYEYSGARVNTAFFEQAGFRGGSWSRHALSLGVGLVF